jgi:type I protein arginine methyltransferase
MSSFRIPAQHLGDVSDDSHVEDDASSSEDDDDTWEDWVSDSVEKQPCRSLFDNTTLNSVSEALEHDKRTYGFDLNEVYSKLCMSAYV